MKPADSQAPAVRALMEGPPRDGIVMGHGHVDFGGYVVTVTPPGRARMPNGIVCGLEPRPGEAATIGGGRFQVGGGAVGVGPDWDARPGLAAVGVEPPAAAPNPVTLAGRGPGLTPDGDDLIAGYVAGLTLLHARTGEAAALAEAAAARTTALSATLLRHAARGELPEPAHVYLERGSESELRAWGQSSGTMLLRGLQLAGARTRV